MDLLFCLVVATALVSIIMFIVSFLYDYFSQVDMSGTVVLSFDEFFQYYCLNPDSWNVEHSFLSKKGCPPYYCRIKFSSYLKYWLFVYRRDKGHFNKKANETKIAFLKEIQKDIDKCKAEANRYNKQGIDMLNDLLTK